MLEFNPLTIVFFALVAGLAVQFVLRLVYGVRGPEHRDPIHFGARLISWVLLVPALVLLMLVSMYGVVPFLIIAFSWLEMTLARRNHKRAEAWSLVTRAAIAGRSIEKSLGSNLGRFRGSTRRALKRFVKEVGDGLSVETAIVNNPRAFPPLAQACAALAVDGGVPLTAVVEDDRVSRGESGLWRLTRRFSYLLWVLLAMVGVVTFIFVAIVPAFEDIYSEFGLELPGISLALIGALRWPLVDYLFKVLSSALLLAVLCTLVALFAYALEWSVLRWLTDRMSYAWRRADLLRLLANILDSGMPLPYAVRRLGSGKPRYPSRLICRRLRSCHQLMYQGMAWPEAMQQAGLLNSVDGDLLSASQSAGNAAWALRSIAERHVARASFRWEAWQQIAFVGMVLLFGVVVGWICVALFLPLVKLINGLT